MRLGLVAFLLNALHWQRFALLVLVAQGGAISVGVFGAGRLQLIESFLQVSIFKCLKNLISNVVAQFVGEFVLDLLLNNFTNLFVGHF